MSRLSPLRSFIFSTSIIAPLTVLIIYIAILVILRGTLPPANEIISHLESLYSRFGYEIIFLGAFLEGALIIDLFVPGSSIVLFGAIFSRTGQIQFPFYLISAIAGFTLGFFMDYLLGYYGWSDIFNKLGLGNELERAKKKVTEFGGKAFLIGYFHPDVATVFATAAGIIRLPVKEFFLYNFLAGFFWLFFWSTLAYFIGDELITALRQYSLEVLIILVVFWFFIKWLLGRKLNVRT